MDGSTKPLIPLTLYDFYFYSLGVAKSMKYDSTYNFSLYDDSKNLFFNSLNLSSFTNFNSCIPLEELNYDRYILILKIQDTSIKINLESFN